MDVEFKQSIFNRSFLTSHQVDSRISVKAVIQASKDSKLGNLTGLNGSNPFCKIENEEVYIRAESYAKDFCQYGITLLAAWIKSIEHNYSYPHRQERQSSRIK